MADCSINEDMVALVRQHDKDLYRGNGKPGLTTRMEVVETKQENLYQGQEKISQSVEQINKRFWLIMLGIAGTFLTVMVDVIFKK
jgi:hypothetical protein